MTKKTENNGYKARWIISFPNRSPSSQQKYWYPLKLNEDYRTRRETEGEIMKTRNDGMLSMQSKGKFQKDKSKINDYRENQINKKSKKRNPYLSQLISVRSKAGTSGRAISPESIAVEQGRAQRERRRRKPPSVSPATKKNSRPGERSRSRFKGSLLAHLPWAQRKKEIYIYIWPLGGSPNGRGLAFTFHQLWNGDMIFMDSPIKFKNLFKIYNQDDKRYFNNTMLMYLLMVRTYLSIVKRVHSPNRI